jgi:tetratricopeptide (TPR) repeat protein
VFDGLLLDEGVVAEAGQEDGAGFAAEPGGLAFGVLAGGEEGEAGGFGDVPTAVENAGGFLISNGLKRFGGGGEPGGEEGAEFVDKSGIKECLGAACDAAAEGLAFGEEDELERSEAGKGFRGGGEDGGGGAAGEEADFDGADEFLAVAAVDAGGGGRVPPVEETVEGAGAAAVESIEAGAEGGVAAGSGAESVEGGAQVESGAAGEDGQAPAAGDVVNQGAGKGGEAPGVAVPGGVEDVDKVMGDAGAFGGGQFGGADVQPAVELERIAVDDFAAEGRGEAESEGGFAGGGGPEYGNQRPHKRLGHKISVPPEASRLVPTSDIVSEYNLPPRVSRSGWRGHKGTAQLSMKLVLRVLPAAAVLAAAALTTPGWSQTAPDRPAAVSKSDAYYHAALAHLYAELAATYGGRGEYVMKAVENYKKAMDADPESGYLANELADLYLQTGQIRTAVGEFEERVKRNPDDVNARRILAKFYTARLREGSQTRLNQEMLNAAIDQYTRVTALAPADIEAWLMLGRLEKANQNSPAAETAFKQALALDEENEDAMTGLAMVYGDLGDTAGASEMLRKVAQKNPNLRTLTTLASTYEQMKEYALAAETYGRALEMNRENTDLKRAYAQALFTAEQYDKAQQVLEELIQEDANDLLANLRLSQIYRQKRQYAKAREYATRARQLDPNNIEIRYNEVALLEAEGKTLEAIAQMRQMVDAIPATTNSISERSNRVILLERLGILHRMAEQTNEAVAAFREIVKTDPEVGSRASAQIIDTLRVGKDFAGAEKELNFALQQYPDDRLVKVVGSNLYADLGKFDRAEAMLKRLMGGEQDRETLLSLAHVYEKAKNFKEMEKTINAAEKLSRTDEEKEGVYFLRGAMFEKQKKFDKAEAEFRRVLAMNPDSASALNYLGYMLADRNERLQEALEMIQKAVDMDPHNAAFLDSLGWVYYRLNRLEEAEEYLRRSLERGSRDPTVHDHLGDVLFSQNNLKAAIAQWEIAIREWQANAPSEVDVKEVAKIEQKLENARVRLARETGQPAPPRN